MRFSPRRLKPNRYSLPATSLNPNPWPVSRWLQNPDEITKPQSLDGGRALSKPGRCFTKQAGDMVYTMAENSWLSQHWLDA